MLYCSKYPTSVVIWESLKQPGLVIMTLLQNVETFYKMFISYLV